MHMNIKSDLRPVRANVICRRPSSLLTQHLQAYRGDIKEDMLRYSPSICCQYYYPGMITTSILSVNDQIIMIDQSTFTSLI